MGEKRGKETNDPRIEEWTDIHILYLMLSFVYIIIIIAVVAVFLLFFLFFFIL